MPDVYAISGAKGGVGKTTTAANLAATLAAAGHSVVAVDGDIGTPNLGPALGVTPGPDDPTIHDVLAGDATLSAAAYEGPHGIYVVPGRDDLDSFRRADPTRLGAALSSVSGVDYVIVDTSAGLTHESALPLSLADGVLLVTTPDRDALSATQKSLELTGELGGTVAGVAVNRAREDSADPELGAPLLGRIPESRDLAAGSAVGEPVTVRSPGGDVALAFRRLASRLAVERVPPPPAVDDARAGPSGADAPDTRGGDTDRGDTTPETDDSRRPEDVPRGAPDGAGDRRDTTRATPQRDAPSDTDPTPNAEPTPQTDVEPDTPEEPDAETEAEPGTEPAPDERIDDDGVIIRDDGDEEDPAAAEARRTVLGETVPESAISREETERGDAVEYEIDEDAIPFSTDDHDDDDEDDDSGGFLGRLFRS